MGSFLGTSKVGVDAGAYKDPNLKANKARLDNRIGMVDNSAGFDTATQDQFRQGQAGLVSQLQGQVAGTAGPSIAEMQLQRGQEANIQAQMAQAASARGANAGLTQRNLAQQLAQGGQAVNADAGFLRAQEQQAAQQTLAQTLGGARGQDVQVAQADIQAQQQQEAIVQQYLQMGMSLDAAQFQANQDLANARFNDAAQANKGKQAIFGGIVKGAGSALAKVATAGAA